MSKEVLVRGFPTALIDSVDGSVNPGWATATCLCKKQVYLSPLDSAVAESTGASVRCPDCVRL